MVETIAETARLRLREWDEADADRFYAVMNTPAVMEHLGGVQTPDEWRAAFERLRGYQRDFGHSFWLIERLADGELLGFCGLKRVNNDGAPNSGDMEIGWRLRESAWGQGIAKEAAVATLDLAFGRFGAPHAVALTFAANRASWGLMERLGMAYRAELDFVDPRFPDQVVKQWRIDAADWPAARVAVA